jgi:hypothetical protein
VAEGTTDPARLAEALRASVHQGERYVEFGEMTRGEVAAQAERIAAAGSWGPLARAAKVARAWRDLASAMDASGAERVSDLDPDDIVKWAERAWVIPPAEGMI